jgi:hypothetical protein
MPYVTFQRKKRKKASVFWVLIWYGIVAILHRQLETCNKKNSNTVNLLEGNQILWIKINEGFDKKEQTSWSLILIIG